MSLWSRLMPRRRQEKASAAGPAIAAFTLGRPVWTPRRYDALADEGFLKNVIAYRCIKEVARGAGGVSWLLFAGEREIDSHPLLDLLRRPNPAEAGPAFWERVFAFLQIAGNSYIEAVTAGGGGSPGAAPRELWALRPDRMRVVPGMSGLPLAYEYQAQGRTQRWEADPVTGASDILQLAEFHPLNDWYGLSPIEVAGFAIDQHNAAGEHNAALLQNGARPSGALVFRSDPGEDNLERARQLLLERFQSPRNAGKPMVLGGDASWLDMALSPREMDFNEGALQQARNICAAFGVPHLLVVPGEATYRNREDARLELWEQTIVPLLERVVASLNGWLAPRFGRGLRIDFDLDRVSALTPRRRRHREQVVREYQAGILTLNEARRALQYEALADGERPRPSPRSE